MSSPKGETFREECEPTLPQGSPQGDMSGSEGGQRAVTRRRSLADFEDSLAVLKFGLDEWPSFFQSCQKWSRSAISHAQLNQAKAVARTGGKMKEILVFADQNSILVYGDLMEFHICHTALPIVQSVRGILAHALEPIG